MGRITIPYLLLLNAIMHAPILIYTFVLRVARVWTITVRMFHDSLPDFE